MFCPQCGKPNDDSSLFCSSCGASLTASHHGGGGAVATQEEYYRAYLGPTNAAYYLEHFKRFDAAGTAGISWNWPAFFITFYWLLYRKMWWPAVIYFIAPYVAMMAIGIATAMAGDNGGAVAAIGYLLLFAAEFIVVPMYANALYYHHCRKRIAEAQAESHDLQRIFGTLSGRGGVSWLPAIIFGVFLFIAVIGILAAIAIPQYNTYRARAQLVSAETYGRQAGDAVAKYYYLHQGLPSSLDETGFNGALPPGVKSISLDSDNGVVTIVMSSVPVTDKSLYLVPELDEQGQISWSCSSDDIKGQYLPKSCQSE